MYAAPNALRTRRILELSQIFASTQMYKLNNCQIERQPVSPFE
jgi:hypothetical protein